jgi:hypothetical protein
LNCGIGDFRRPTANDWAFFRLALSVRRSSSKLARLLVAKFVSRLISKQE